MGERGSAAAQGMHVAQHVASHIAACHPPAQVIRRGGHSITGKRSSALFLAGRGFMGMVSMTAFYLALTLLPLGDVSSIFFM